MVEIAAADPCPAPDTWNGKPISNDVMILQEDLGGNLIKYYAKSTTDKSPVDGNPGFKEICIVSSTGFGSLTQIWNPAVWSAMSQNPGPYVRFQGGGNPDNMPFDGNIYTVGTVQWNAAPQNIKTLVHVISKDLCPNSAGNTCFVRPPNPPGVVPELATIVLTSTGILGLVAISRKYRNK